MAKVLVAYYSRTGNTKKMAEAAGEGVKRAVGEVDILGIEEIGDPSSLVEYQG